MYKNQAQQINRFNVFYYNFMTGNENHVANKLLKWIATRVWGGGGMEKNWTSVYSPVIYQLS